MNILSLPVELQENILVNIPHETKIELVCRLWNEICKKEVIVNRRFSCICLELCLTLVHLISVNLRHKCICNLSVHHAKGERQQITHVFVKMAPITQSIVKQRPIRVYVKMIRIVFITLLCEEKPPMYSATNT